MDIKEFINGKREEMTELLGRLVSCRSIRDKASEGKPFGEETARALNEMLDKAEELGFAVKNLNGYCGYVDFVPKGADGIKLGILCHLDVVPAGEGWTVAPFELTEKDGKLYGRGTTDDKGPSVSALYALYAIKELAVELKSGVRLIFGADEENGSSDIAYYLTKEKMPPMTFTPDAQYPVINCEKGMMRAAFSLPLPKWLLSFSGGQVVNAVPSYAIAEIDGKYADEVIAAADGIENISAVKEGGKAVVSFKGRSAHASTPDSGINAVTGLIGFLSKLDLCENGGALKALANLFPFGETDGRSLGLKMSDKLSGDLTEVLSIAQTREGKAFFRMDIRFPICSSCAQIWEKLSATLSENGISPDEHEGSEPHYTDSDSELVRSLLKVYKRFTKEDGGCISIGGGTYVHGIDGGVAFGVEHEGTDYRIHGADEFVPTAEFIENTEIFAEAIREICG